MSESKKKLSDMTTEDLCDLLIITRKRVHAIEKVLNERQRPPECTHDFVRNFMHACSACPGVGGVSR